MNCLPLTAYCFPLTAYRLLFTAFRRTSLLSHFATFCAIAVTVVFLSSPCRAEQEDTSLDPPSEEVSTAEEAGDTSEKEEDSAIKRRKREEKRAGTGLFSLSTHRQNYFLPLAYNSNSNRETYNAAGENKPSNTEVKFQFSFKVLLWEKMFWGNGDLFFGYTQLSFWQLYDKDMSSPFRETNYEPEVFFKFDTDFNVLGFRNRLITIGFNHESNGRGQELSRSWNRVFGVFAADRGNLFIALKPWYRIPEDDDDDDNPNIEKYMGYGELFGAYRLKGHIFSFMLRNNLRQNNRGAVELGWSYPILTNLRLYAQYFNGYGESLADYDHSVNRIGIGVMLNDWI
jgi:phospholipase A1